MPRIDSHPLYLLRLRAGISRSALADRIGVTRQTIAAIEEGRTNHPTPQTLQQIDRVLGVRPGTLTHQMEVWRRARAAAGVQLSLMQRAMLSQPAADVKRFRSFADWRARFAPNPTAFASMLGLNHTVVARYEQGIREKGMPDTLAHALLTVLGVREDYLVALKQLEPNHD